MFAAPSTSKERAVRSLHLAWAVWMCLAARSATAQAKAATTPPTRSSGATPLILEANEGERRMWRPVEGASGWDTVPGPFVLKVDRRNGGSAHLVFGTEDLPPGATIDRHLHPGSDEILFLQNGTAHVTVGTLERDAHAGSTVFIPANTWVSLTNRGPEPIHMVFAFSAPGFNDYMRAESVPEGQPAARLSSAEDAEIQRRYRNAVVYAKP